MSQLDTIPRPADTVYHGLLGRIVKTVDPGTEADPVGVLGSLIVGVSAYLGPAVRVRISALDDHPILCWSLLIGRTSKGRKGSATSAAKRVLALLDKDFFGANTVSGLSSGEGLIHEVKDPDPSELEEMMEVGINPGDIGDQRRLVIESEYGMTMLRSSGMSSLSTILRQAWDGDDLKTRTRRNSMTATRPHIALLGHISPKEFRARLSERELAGGTYNRLLMLHVHQSKTLPDGGMVDLDRVAGQAAKLRANIERARDLELVVVRNEAANKYWAESLYPEIANDDSQNEVLEQFSARRAPYTLRLAALYAVADGRSEIDVPDLQAANALYEYCLDSIEYTIANAAPAAIAGNGKVSGEMANRHYESLRKALLAAGDEGLKKKDIWDLVGKNFNKDQVDEMLVTLGVASRPGARSANGGRPPMVYYIPSEDGDGFV
ncbi:DUF3987 domain-containing protein [Kitasatospora sp. NPDC001309]|uniref:DUF3987 domain-containing protein n=1 Tax=Kitasatospora sp. NPDC001309 TaxID=3364013 RepID=UPI0036AAF708